MDTKNFYFGQQPTAGEVNLAFGKVEQNLTDDLIKHGWHGIAKNPWLPTHIFMISEDAPPLLEVLCSGGYGYDKSGNRIVRSTGAADKIDVSTILPSAGNTAFGSIFVRAKKQTSDQRVDASGNTVYFNQDDNHEFILELGAEVAKPGPPVAYPALKDDALLLCDILLEDTTASITGYGTAVGEIDLTRTQYWEDTADQYGAKTIVASELMKHKANLGGSPATATPEKIYGESFIKAWAAVDAAGAIVESYNVSSAARAGPGDYLVTVPAGLFNAQTDIIPIATVGTTGGDPNPNVIESDPTSATQIRVQTYRYNIGTDEFDIWDAQFFLLICGRPKL